MRRRSPSLRRVPLPPGAVKWIVIFNLATAGLLGGWYLFQPAPRQAEVSRLVANAFERDKQVTFFEIAWDIWQLYYADSATGRIAPGDKTTVYGGPPQLVGAEAAGETVRVLANRGYVVGYSDALKNPRWAAYRMQDLERIPAVARRPDKFEVDRRTAARVTPQSYSGSGYDRGHLAPNYAIATRYGEEAQRETFLMSNITPQAHALNAGLWRELEMKIATSYPARYGEVWVLVGPVFGARLTKLKGGIAIPEAFFMIVIDENEGKLRTLAFLVPQEVPAEADPARYLTTIAEIQRRTGLDFLSEIEDEAERQIEAQKAARLW
jgi:endonuclease G